MSALLELTDIHKHFHQGAGETDLHILRGVDLALSRGEHLALVGPSGCGKTTLLQIIGLLDHPSKGSIHIDGVDLSRASDTKRTQTRLSRLGFVYQFHHLLPEFSALENIMLPQMLAGKGRAESAARATELLSLLKLEARLNHRPSQLSGGEQQRVAIARALANGPALLLADEPTGNLDPDTAGEVMALLMTTLAQTDSACLMVTHNHTLARQMQRVVTLDHGRLQTL